MDEPSNPILERVNPRMLKSEPIQRCCLDDCHGACCIFGVWVDQREVEDILANADVISPHMPESNQNPGEWFAAVQDNDQRSPTGKVIHTAVETVPDHYGGTACVFWRDDGKCALQVAAYENGLHPWRYKPYYCILHPLDMDEEGRITLDHADEMVNETGSCVRSAPSAIPLYETFEPELRYLLGEKGYQSLCRMAKKDRSSILQVK